MISISPQNPREYQARQRKPTDRETRVRERAISAVVSALVDILAVADPDGEATDMWATEARRALRQAREAGL